MKILFASDHAGFEMKNALMEYAHDELGHEVVDMGASEHNEDDDYPDYIAPAASALSGGEGDRAVLLGGSGQGEAMLANRFPGVRAAVFYGGPKDIVTLSREHNDANALSLGARFIDLSEAKEILALWLSTEHPENDRYDNRIAKAEVLAP